MIPESHMRALGIICEQLQDSGVEWALTGSLGLALQGMNVEVHDIDVQTDEAGVYEIERRLADYVVKPVLYKSSERMRSRMGKLSIEGVTVEIMGGIEKRLPDGAWQEPVDIAQHSLKLEVEGVSVPVLSLQHEYESYKLMDRTERAAQIRKWLDRKDKDAG